MTQIPSSVRLYAEDRIEDGTPHLTFYEATSRLSFVWNGKGRILVEEDGYGEPVIDVIPVNEATRNSIEQVPILSVLDWFERTCRDYAAKAMKEVRR